MPAAPTSYVVLDIGYQTILLPGSTNVDRLMRALTGAISVRRSFEGLRDVYKIDGDSVVELRCTMIPASHVQLTPEAMAGGSSSPRTHTAALPLPKSRRLPA